MARTPPPRRYAEDAAFPERIELKPIGVVRSPHKERHGTPRQAVVPANPELPASRCSQDLGPNPKWFCRHLFGPFYILLTKPPCQG